MALILCIETSTDICSVCLCENGTVVNMLEQSDKNHASQLVPMINQLFKISGLSKRNLKAVAVSAGPGSFTGLRIGVATAKAICYAENIPLIALSSLQILAMGVGKKDDTPETVICAVIDAGRNGIYYGLYDSNGNCLQQDAAAELSHLLFNTVYFNRIVVFTGSGAEKCRNFLSNSTGFFFEVNNKPSAQFMSELSCQSLQQHAFSALASFEPFYLKPAYIRKEN